MVLNNLSVLAAWAALAKDYAERGVDSNAIKIGEDAFFKGALAMHTLLHVIASLPDDTTFAEETMQHMLDELMAKLEMGVLNDHGVKLN